MSAAAPVRGRDAEPRDAPTRPGLEPGRPGSRPCSMIAGPILLALLIFSGSLKTNALIPTLPIDLSILLAVLVVVFAAGSIVTLGLPRRTVLWVPALWVVLALALIPYAGSSEYIATKTSNLFTITLVIALAPFFLLRAHRQRRWFLAGIVAVALVTLAGAVLVPAAESARFLPEGANPIDFGRTVGAGALILILIGLARAATSGPARLAALALGFVLLAGMFAAGSRGPAVGILVALLAVFLAAPAFRRQRARGMLVTGALIAAVALWLANSGQSGFDRLLESLAGGSGDVTNGRESLWQIASRIIAEHPLGVGLGGYSQAAHDSYPHNLLLEVFAEFGWLTGALLVVLALASLVRLGMRATTPLLAVMFGLAVLATTAALFSSDLNGNRLLWVMLAFAWTLDAPAAGDSAAGAATAGPLAAGPVAAGHVAAGSAAAGPTAATAGPARDR